MQKLPDDEFYAPYEGHNKYVLTNDSGEELVISRNYETNHNREVDNDLIHVRLNGDTSSWTRAEGLDMIRAIVETLASYDDAE